MYSLPTANNWNWDVGTTVGITGGLEQYREGGINERTNLLNLTLAPYYLNLDNPETTGTISAGGSVMAVADSTGFRVNDYVKIVDSYPEVVEIVVTSASSADGNVFFVLGGSGYFIPILDADTINQVATKIRDHSYSGYTTSGTGATITITAITITIMIAIINIMIGQFMITFNTICGSYNFK